MKLNMHILFEELAPLKPKASIHSDRLERQFAFHSPMIDFKTGSSNLVYNVTADQLEEIVARGITPHASFVCSGTPPQEIIDSGCDIIWIESAPVIGEMVVRMTEIFTTYMIWETQVHDAIVKGASLKTIAELSKDIIRRPIWAWDPYYQTLFNITGPEEHTFPDDYIKQNDFSHWDAWMVAQWEEEASKWGGRLTRTREPFFMPTPAEGGRSYRCLCSNIFHGPSRVATVCIDEVGPELTDRDFALIDILSGFMTEGLSYGGGTEQKTVEVFDEPLMNLIRGLPVTHHELKETQARMNWDDRDEYFIVALEPDGEPYSNRMLTRLAHELCSQIEGSVFAVHGRKLLIAVNAMRISLDHRAAAAEVDRILSDQNIHMRIGVSSLWQGLDKFLHCYRQAIQAINIGRSRLLKSCVFFEDVIALNVLQRCMEGEDIETLMPLGLRRLIIHDEEQQDDLADTLRTFLDNNCSMTAASRALFVHRNTLSYKIERIKGILKSDLADAEERFLLALMLRLSQVR